MVSSAIGIVNPPIIGTLKVSTGYTTNADGTRAPTYQIINGVPLQVQALSTGQMMHTDALNIQGVLRTVFLNGNIEGLDRALQKGGDILVFDGQEWLVVETQVWPSGWTSVTVRQQA
jgi:hypothetical protein